MTDDAKRPSGDPRVKDGKFQVNYAGKLTALSKVCSDKKTELNLIIDLTLLSEGECDLLDGFLVRNYQALVSAGTGATYPKPNSEPPEPVIDPPEPPPPAPAPEPPPPAPPSAP